MPAPKDPEKYKLWRERLLARPKRVYTRKAPKSRRLPPKEKALADIARHKRMRELALRINSTPEMRAKRSASNRKRGVAMLHTPEARAAHKAGLTGRRHSQATKDKISKANIERLQKVDFTARVPLVSKKYLGSRRFLRSQLEAEFVSLMENDPSVLSFSYETVRVVYSEIRRTLVDFLVETTSGKVLAEVKAAFAVERCQEKLQAAEKYALSQGWGWRVWTEKDSYPEPLSGCAMSTT